MPSKNAPILAKRLADQYFTGTFRLLLVSSEPDEATTDALEFRSQVANEVSGTGYTAGGADITVTVGAKDTTNNRVAITLGSVSIPNATITARGGWLYKVVGTAATLDAVDAPPGLTVTPQLAVGSALPSGVVRFAASQPQGPGPYEVALRVASTAGRKKTGVVSIAIST